MTDHLERLFDTDALLEQQKALERAAAGAAALGERRSDPSGGEELLRSVAWLAQAVEQGTAKEQEQVELAGDSPWQRELDVPQLERIRRRLATWLNGGRTVSSGMEDGESQADPAGVFPMELPGGGYVSGVEWEGAVAPSFHPSMDFSAEAEPGSEGRGMVSSDVRASEPARSLERRLRRDSRRYDSGFFLY